MTKIQNPILRGFNPIHQFCGSVMIIILPHPHLNGFQECRSTIPKGSVVGGDCSSS